MNRGAALTPLLSIECSFQPARTESIATCSGRFPGPALLGALEVHSFCRIDANAISLFDERRDLNRDSCFQLGRLRAVGSSCAFHFGLSLNDRQLDRRGKFDSHRLAVEEFDLDLGPSNQVTYGIAQRL